jgi:DoxX-like family
MTASTFKPTSESLPQNPGTTPVSNKSLWTGRILSGVLSALFVLDGVMKLIKPVQVVQATVQLGYPESTIVGIGIVLLISTILYLIPRTAFFGAVLLTGYLGGAVATNVRVSGPLFNIVFPIFFGCLVWVGLYLRDRRLKLILA